ncbi:unnamed protein product [Zymoseptoria tritici ST99CH_3D7]|uniref:Uncharacterized protein n=1 Tax=Zymoseptoria tritici (strain ST99CH_3D7) TaxID=1276538 RepID=A0A1X7RZB8_ZYMT9|nr:unnamed protein product [Zymoseptoria tritici ST99CH_3D7]
MTTTLKNIWFGIADEPAPPQQQINIRLVAATPPTSSDLRTLTTPNVISFSKSRANYQYFIFLIHTRKEDNPHILNPADLNLADLESSFEGLTFTDVVTGDPVRRIGFWDNRQEWEVSREISDLGGEREFFMAHQLGRYSTGFDFKVGQLVKVGLKGVRLRAAAGAVSDRYVLIEEAFFTVME